jgi:hypothetical protein
MTAESEVKQTVLVEVPQRTLDALEQDHDHITQIRAAMAKVRYQEDVVSGIKDELKDAKTELDLRQAKMNDLIESGPPKVDPQQMLPFGVVSTDDEEGDEDEENDFDSLDDDPSDDETIGGDGESIDGDDEANLPDGESIDAEGESIGPDDESPAVANESAAVESQPKLKVPDFIMLMAIPMKSKNALAATGVTNLAELQNLANGNNPKYPKGLPDVKGLGRKSIESLIEEMPSTAKEQPKVKDTPNGEVKKIQALSFMTGESYSIEAGNKYDAMVMHDGKAIVELGTERFELAEYDYELVVEE